MADQKGNRKYIRHDLEALITCSYFNKANFFSARLVNYSESGLCIESDSKLQPGASLFIRLEKLLPNQAGTKIHEGFRSVTLGEARWCREIAENGSCKYITGVQYYESDY